MEITRTPPHLEGFQCFHVDQATEVTKRYLPERSFDSHASMLTAITHIFGTSEMEVQENVLLSFAAADFEIQATVTDWLNIRGITRGGYQRQLKNKKLPVDGLFIWLAVKHYHQHINLMHASGIWTSRHSEYVVMTDPTVILIVGCFLMAAGMLLDDLKKDSEYMSCFHHPLEVQSGFVPVPKVLNKPIVHLGEWLEEIGFHPCGE